MKRNRIVINMDSPRPKKSRGRLGKVLLIVALVLLLIVGGLGTGGYFWWRNFQNGPAYALAVMVDAVQRNDTATFDKMIDVDKISADFVSQVRDKMSGSLSGSLSSTQTDAATAAVSAKLKETIHEQLINELRGLTEVAKGKPLFIVALGVPYFADIKQENSTASATVNIKNEVIKLNMQAEDNHWRIVAVQDEKLAKMVADAVVKSLPANGSGVQDEIRKQLDKWGK
jgi:flagellar basal body-associated protein FliL